MNKQLSYSGLSSTPGQWLRHSAGWTAGCLVGVWLCSQALVQLGHYQKVANLDVAGSLMFGGLCAAHYLIWRRALPGSAAAFAHEIYYNRFSWIVLVAGLWRAALFLFQLGCSLLLLAWMVTQLFQLELIKQFT